jgi:beta-lactamase class A
MKLIQQGPGGFLILTLLICWPHVLWGERTAAAAGDLESKVAKLVEGFTGSVGIYAHDLNTGREFAYHADELFGTASVFKVPVLVELFRRAEAGELRLDDRRRVPATGISRHGTGVLKNLRDQPEMTLLDFSRLMVIYSDNIATDTLMQVVDAAAVTATMQRLGFPNTRVAGDCTTMHYRMFGIDPPIGSAANDDLLLARIKEGKRVKGAGFTDRSLNGNVTTPREMGTIFVKLYRGEILAKSSGQMLEILKQTASRKMASRLPAEIVVAHKIGGTEGVSSDVGIIYMPQGPIVVSLFVNYDAPNSRASTLVPDLGKLLAEEFPQP